MSRTRGSAGRTTCSGNADDECGLRRRGQPPWGRCSSSRNHHKIPQQVAEERPSTPKWNSSVSAVAQARGGRRSDGDLSARARRGSGPSSAGRRRSPLAIHTSHCERRARSCGGSWSRNRRDNCLRGASWCYAAQRKNPDTPQARERMALPAGIGTDSGEKLKRVPARITEALGREQGKRYVLFYSPSLSVSEPDSPELLLSLSLL